MPADELDEQRAPLGQFAAAKFQAQDAVAAHLLERDQLGARQFLDHAPEEGPERPLVQGHALVLQVQARRVGVGREAQAQDAPAARGLEHQQEVGGRQRVHVAHARARAERSELGEQLGEVRRGEVQASSSSTL